MPRRHRPRATSWHSPTAMPSPNASSGSRQLDSGPVSRRVPADACGALAGPLCRHRNRDTDPDDGEPLFQHDVLRLERRARACRVAVSEQSSSAAGSSRCASMLAIVNDLQAAAFARRSFLALSSRTWMTAASCKCRAVVERNSPLSPGADSQILSCPIKLQGRRVMWNWYTTGERPIMFTEAQPEGSGVMLADYHDWLPGQAVPPKNFDLPNACKATRSEADASFSNPSCSDCHSTPW